MIGICFFCALVMAAKLTESQKVVKLTICQCNFNVLQGVPAAVELFLQNRQS
jgi:hypothetical protein